MLSLHPKLVELQKTIRVGAVSYLNTKPLMYAFKHGDAIDGVTIKEDYPARVAAMLLNNEIDVGLVPVAILPRLSEHYIITDYCIGAEGEVASVCLFSQVPLHEIKTVILDNQSRTSVMLAQILIKYHWKLQVQYSVADDNFRTRIKGTTAAVVIGDRAFEQRKFSAFSYDLAQAWLSFTGLPFVFAAWVANKKLPDSFINAFNEANGVGLGRIAAVAAENESPHYDLLKYYTKNISYRLTANKRKGLQEFLRYVQMIESENNQN